MCRAVMGEMGQLPSTFEEGTSGGVFPRAIVSLVSTPSPQTQADDLSSKFEQ